MAALQGLLHALGYLPAENSGAFGADTFVAVTLFQIANGLAPTGEADEELLNALRGESATPLSQAEEALRKSEAAMDAAALSRAAAVAAEMPGQAFDGGANANYPGFPFAQYVYARVGVGLTGPGRILEEAVHQPFDAAGATGGEIVILQNPDGSLLYAVSLGGARIAYADAATGFVVSGDLFFDGAGERLCVEAFRSLTCCCPASGWTTCNAAATASFSGRTPSASARTRCCWRTLPRPGRARRAVDLGCGTGAIATLMAAHEPALCVDAGGAAAGRGRHGAPQRASQPSGRARARLCRGHAPGARLPRPRPVRAGGVQSPLQPRGSGAAKRKTRACAWRGTRATLTAAGVAESAARLLKKRRAACA